MATTQADAGLFDFEGGDLISAGFLTRECEWPILNLKQLFNDPFVRNMPVFYGYWKNGIIQRAVTSVIPTITDPGAGEPLDKCEFGTIATDMNGCEWIVPSMVSVRFKPQHSMTWEEAIDEFCDARRISPEASLITADGLLDSGNEYSLPFARWVYAGLAQGIKTHLEDVVPDGVFGNFMEFDGFETQLENGWTPANAYASNCDHFNTAVQVNWAVLTGGEAGTPEPPTAVIDEDHDTITLWGQPIAGFAGLDLGGFLLRIKELVEEEFAAQFGGVDQWEWLVPYGSKRCIRDLLACVNVCGADAVNDEETRQRYADYYKRDLVEIYPDDTPIMLQQARGITENRVIFGPRMVGGRFTYGWAFRNMDAVVRRLGQVLGAGHRYSNGIDGWNHPLVNHNLDNLRANFETLAFLTKLIEDTDGRCFWPTVEAVTGFLVFARHMFTIVDDVDCAVVTTGANQLQPLGPITYDVLDCDDVAEPAVFTTELDITILEPVRAPEVNDTVKIMNAAGLVLPGVVVAYDDADPFVVTVGFDGITTDCVTLVPTKIQI